MNSLWSELNGRQRIYLRALFVLVAVKERSQVEAAHGLWDRTPASEWRWMQYGPVAPPAPFWYVLVAAQVMQHRRNLAALEQRECIQCRMPLWENRHA